jgi:hypothetical protein
MDNSKLTPNVKRLIELLERNVVDLVSYGLAPNPFGFCYETNDKFTNDADLPEINQLLDCLTTDEENTIRQAYFN